LWVRSWWRAFWERLVFPRVLGWSTEHEKDSPPVGVGGLVLVEEAVLTGFARWDDWRYLAGPAGASGLLWLGVALGAGVLWLMGGC